MRQSIDSLRALHGLYMYRVEELRARLHYGCAKKGLCSSSLDEDVAATLAGFDGNCFVVHREDNERCAILFSLNSNRALWVLRSALNVLKLEEILILKRKSDPEHIVKEKKKRER